MHGLDEVEARLRADASVVGTVDTYLSAPAIYGNPIAPPDYSGRVITMALTAAVDGGLEYGNYLITVSCFGRKYADVVAMQSAVFGALNRKSGQNDASVFFRCSKFPVIPPGQTGGDYNAPVEVLVRQR